MRVPSEHDPVTTAETRTSATPRAHRRAVRGIGPVVFVALVALVSACGSSGDSSTEGGSSAGDAVTSTAGKQLFEANCAVCHGADLRGTDSGPSLLSIVYEPSHHGDDAFRSAIANGSVQHHWDFGNMPPVPGLSDTEADEIIAYVREVQTREGFDRGM